MFKRLHTIIEHQEDLLHKQNRSEDWHVVAVVVDRCLFSGLHSSSKSYLLVHTRV